MKEDALSGFDTASTDPPPGAAPLLSAATQQEEIRGLREMVAQLSLQLDELASREAHAHQRVTILEAERDARGLSDQAPMLAARLSQAEREVEALNAARQSIEAARLDLRHLLNDSEARCEALLSGPAYRLGDLLISALENPRDFLSLPCGLRAWWRDWRQAKDRPQDDRLPARSAAEFVEAAGAVVARAEKHGVEAARQWAVDQRFRAPVLARALLELAKYARRSDPRAAVELARAALDADPTETKVKHLAFTLMDAGAIRDASEILRAAIAQGAPLNGTEARRRDELAALERLQQLGLQLPARAEAAPAPGGPILLYAQQSLPYHWTSTSLRVHALAQCARAAGLAPIVVTPPGYPAKAGAERKPPTTQTLEGVDYLRLEDAGVPAGAIDGHARACGAALAQAIRETGASLIMATLDFSSAYAAAAASALTGAPLALDCQATRPDAPESEREALFQDLEGGLIDRAAIVFARAAAHESRLARAGDRLAFLGDSFPRFAPDPAAPDWRRDPALAGRFVIGYVGDPQEDLDLEQLPCVLDRLLGRGCDAALAVFGVGSRFQKLRATAEAMGHGGRVLFPGRPRLGAIAAAHAAIDLAILPLAPSPSRQQRARFELVEALAHGKAVLTTAAPDDLAACVATTDATVDALAGAAAALAADPMARRAMEARARAVAASVLSPEAMADRLSRLGSLVLAKKA